VTFREAKDGPVEVPVDDGAREPGLCAALDHRRVAQLDPLFLDAV
jgi:hypothetical protein